MKRLPLIVHTLYSELVDLCRHAVPTPEGWPVSAGVVKVSLENREHWYLQKSLRTSPGGYQKRVYLGPAGDPELEEHIRKFAEAKREYEQRRDLIRTLKASGVAAPTGKVANLLLGLGEHGVLGRAVLVGTGAFQAYGSLLGVRFGQSAFQTMDIDLTQAKDVALSHAKTTRLPDLLTLLKDIDDSFRAVPGLGRSTPPVSYINGAGARVDVLSPLVGPDKGVQPTDLSSYGQPVRFLDYLVQESIEAVLLVGGGLLCRLPSPPRFALHKLIVSQRRSATQQARQRKDLAQASELIAVLLEDNREGLALAHQDLMNRGPKWRKLLAAGMQMLPGSVQQGMREIIIT